MNIEEFKKLPKDNQRDQKFITEAFTDLTNSIPELKEFRDLVEKEVYGFGERCFLGMHKMIVDSYDKKNIKALEIGVYKGQILAAWKIIGNLVDKNIDVFGVTPLDSTDGHIESDYLQNIKDLHNIFKLSDPDIIKGYSQDKEVLKLVDSEAPFDIIFIDGHHDYEMVKQDLENYSKMVSDGGYFVIDDCSNDLKGAYWGAFWGIDSVTKAVVEFFNGNNDFEYIGNVVHNKIYRKI
jgi:hypothetical protein